MEASRKPSVVLYSGAKVLQKYTDDRAGILVKCTPIDGHMAKNLLDHGYKQLSKFGRWCPVKVCLWGSIQSIVGSILP